MSNVRPLPAAMPLGAIRELSNGEIGIVHRDPAGRDYVLWGSCAECPAESSAYPNKPMPWKCRHAQRNDHQRRAYVDPLPQPPPSGGGPLRVGDVLEGFCGGHFGRDSYDAKRVEALGADWVVVRNTDGEVETATFNPRHTHAAVECLVEYRRPR